MGADLLLAWVKLPDGSDDERTADELVRRALALSPERAEAVLEQTNPEFFDDPENDQPTAVEYLAERVREAWAAVNGDFRDIVTAEIGGATMLLAGGTSWGDSPGDGFAAVCVLADSRVLDEPMPWAPPRDQWTAVTRSMGCVQMLLNGEHKVNTPFETLSKQEATSLAAWINREDLA